jgi:hypothetical protein
MYATVDGQALQHVSIDDLSMKIRIARVALGSILQWLEASQSDHELLDRLNAAVEIVGAEIDDVVRVIPAQQN